MYKKDLSFMNKKPDILLNKEYPDKKNWGNIF
jgi:hypothetical protein